MSDLTDADVFVQVVDGEEILVNVEDPDPVMFAFMSEQGPEGIQGPPGGEVITVDHVAVDPVYEGVVTAAGNRFITDALASWLVNAFVDRVVKISHVDGSYCVGVVESNTSNTLQFDDDLLDDHEAGDAFAILDTLVLESSTQPTMVAIDTAENNAPCAVLLPLSTPEFERSYVHAYIERAINGDNPCPIVCRGQDRQAGAKYGELIHRTEGVRLYQHQYRVPHWDIIQVYNVKRLATGYWVNSEPVAATSFAPVGDYFSVVYDYLKRFRVMNVSGVPWVVYNSLLERNFLLSFSCSVEKTGGVGDLSITFITFNSDTGIETVHTERVASSRFSAGLGRETITVEIPVTLKRGDRLVPASMRSGGTFSILPGSSVRVTEL